MSLNLFYSTFPSLFVVTVLPQDFMQGEGKFLPLSKIYDVYEKSLYFTRSPSARIDSMVDMSNPLKFSF